MTILLAAAAAGVMAVGGWTVLSGTGANPAGARAHTHRPTPTATAAAATTPAAPPVWISDPQDVLDHTQFVQRYMAENPKITAAHCPDGRPCLNLAQHGATLCAMIADPSATRYDMVVAFLHMHPHKGPHEQHVEVAEGVIELAIQEACPGLRDAYVHKRGI